MFERLLSAVAASAVIVLALITAADSAIASEPLCAADCNDDRRVSIDELVSCTRTSVSGSDVVPACCDADGDGRLAVADLVNAVSGALNGCAVTCADPNGFTHPCPHGGRCDVTENDCAAAFTGSATGTCEPIVANCPPDDLPECGCDGVTYRSACERRRAGATRQATGACQSWSCCPAGAFKTGTILVHFQPGTTEQRATELAGAFGATVIRHLIRLDVYILGVPPGHELELVSRFAAEPEVRNALANYIGCVPESFPCACCPPIEGISCPDLPPC